MASLPPLGEVAVDVTARIDKLLLGFGEANRASTAFDRSMNQNVGRSAANATRQTDLLGGATQKLARDFRPAMIAADRFGTSVARAGNDAQRGAAQINTAASSIRRTLLASAATIAAAFGAREIMQLADSYTSFTNRIRSAGIEGAALAERQQQLFDIAQRYGVELGAVGELFGRVAQAQNDLGASTAQIMQTVEGAAAAVRVYGASTQEQAGAIRQLSQLLGNAKVQMQEFNSLNDGARPLLVAVATGIERFGGSVSRLRAEIMRGGFETKEFFEGLQRGLPAIIEQANRMPLTIGASFQVLNNALGQYIGQTDRSLSATQRIGGAIRALANNLGTIMPILTAIVLAIGARYVAAMGAAVVATIRKTAVDAAAALAANVLATAQGRVTTTMGASIIPTTAYAGSLSAVTITANAATAGLTRMQIVMATAGAMARGVGAAMLAAFGGWVGLAILAVVGTVIIYNRSMAAARQAVIDFNEHHRTAVQLLREEATNSRTASGEIRSLGQTHQTATGYVRAFAGATGDAADALHRQAVEARNARLELLRNAATASRTDYNTISAQMTARADTLMRRRVATPYQDDPEWQDMNRRAQAARRDAERLEAALAQAGGRPLESWAGPNVRTQGRDLPAEIAQQRAQLLVAQRNGNQELQRSILAEIKLRERIIALMETGLNLENAQAQAQAERLRAPGRGQDPTTVLPFDRPVPGSVLSPFGVQRNNGRFASGRRMPNHPHAGVDINAAEGTPVRAPQAGFARRKSNAEGLGIYVEIDHGGGTRTRLAHLSVADVPAEGMRVERGQVVGRTGRTGNAAGGTPHLHYERRENGRNVNPLNPTGQGDPASLDDEVERAEEERIRNERQFTDELAGMNREILDARRDQTVDAEALAQMERERIGVERDRQKAEIESRHALGQYTDAQRDQALSANEQLRTLQLSAVALRERERVIQESLRTATATHEREMDVLEAQRDLARTATQRRAVERRILAAQEEQERLALQAIIDSPTTLPVDRRIAEADRDSLGRRYGARRGALDRQARDELLGTAPEGSETAHRQEMEAIREREQERLSIVQEALAAELISREEAARRRVEIEIDAQNQLREAQISADVARLQSAQATANSLAQIAQALFGEHSRAARAMFIVSKGFAIAEAVLQLQVALAKALALGFPQNIPAIASVAALGASIISNIVAITGQFEAGGYTGGGGTKQIAGMVHGQEFVINAAATRRNRPLLENINAGRYPGFGAREGMGGGRGGLSVAIHNHAPGVEHEVRQRSDGEIEIIARKVVQREAPGVIATDLANPNSRTGKAVQRHTNAGRKRA